MSKSLRAVIYARYKSDNKHNFKLSKINDWISNGLSKD